MNGKSEDVLGVSQLTCLDACVPCGCCTPKQEECSPHPQEPETDKWDQITNHEGFQSALGSLKTTAFYHFSIQGQDHHLMEKTNSYLPVNFIIKAVVISRVAPDRQL